MGRLRLGLVLIALILVSGLFLENRMEKVFHPRAEDLEEAAYWAGQENWGKAEALMKQARAGWAEKRNLAAALVHHGVLDDIDIRFAELEAAARNRERMAFQSGCAGLALQLRNLPKVHSFAWWNLL